MTPIKNFCSCQVRAKKTKKKAKVNQVNTPNRAYIQRQNYEIVIVVEQHLGILV